MELHTKGHILLVEDSPGDVRLLKEALTEAAIPHRLSVVSDGDEALDFLHRKGRYGNETLPSLILLDLNLPRRSGHEVLRTIKEEAELRRIPVVVYSSSRADSDVALAYELHANCYIVKPSDLEGVFRVMNAIKTFWLNVAELPQTI